MGGGVPDFFGVVKGGYQFFSVGQAGGGMCDVEQAANFFLRMSSEQREYFP